MMKRMSLLFGLILIMLSSKMSAQYAENYLSKISEQLIKMDNTFDGRYPDYTINGIYKYRDNVNWFSGFTAGELWNIYDLTKDENLRERAISHADALLEYASIDYTHDMGFIFLPSVVRAYQQTGLEKYRIAGITAASMLVKRFNSNGNFIRAWGAVGDSSKAGWMIIDTMLNLELLFWAWQETGNVEYYDIAYKHAITCMKENVRKDFSSHHVIEFDPETGKVLKKRTHQGWKDETTWARGQAWGIYGFANAYKYTLDERFLLTSKKMADVFIQALPEDHVPYWDLSLSGKAVVKDASAAAIASSGMYILADQTNEKSDYQKYFGYANSIAESIINNYTFLNSKREYEEGLLIQTVYNYHKDWGVNESYPCGDYYFTEVLKKYKHFNNILLKNEEGRSEILLNDNWFYLEDNPKNINELQYSSKIWQKINLPHSWNNFDAVDAQPGYRRDASWYEKEILLGEIEADKLYKLFFEATNILSEIFVNGKSIGGHVGGYVGFEVDITNHLAIGSNQILIRVDNSINPEIIPSQVSDFFIYGGIPRDVWFRIIPRTNISQLKISTPSVSVDKAETKIDLIIDSGDNYKVELLIELLDPDDEMVQKVNKSYNVVNGENKIEVSLEEITNPKLWSTNVPNLYSIKVSLSNDGKRIDQLEDRFGYRWFEFKPHGPFYLNGERLLLRGTHRHEDHAGLANALPNSQHRKDIEMIKDMGANFIRLAHYPQDLEVYKACDELGLLVWDELPWCRGGVGGKEWKNNTTHLFKEMINQNFNHPSIIIWSVGNEVYWLPEQEDGDNIDSLKKFTKTLVDLAHDLDKGRLTSIRKFYEGADLVDVFSPSIWAGWYNGVYKSYKKAIEDAQNKYSHFFHAEYGGSSHLGRHTENPITGEGFLNPEEWSESVNQVKIRNIANIGDWSENYIVDLFDWHLNITENSENFTGNAQWAFKDFGTPLRPENSIPYLNQKGLVDRAGNPKDAYYVFKSYWNDKDKFAYIESHTWKERSGPKGKEREVCVYSNCAEVELFVNDVSLGKKKKDSNNYPASGLNWDVKFKEGNNFIEAVGFEHSVKKANDKLEILYSYEQNGAPEKIKLSAERMKNGNYLITGLAIDNNGNRCLDYNERVYFSAEGNGKLVENYGTPTRSSIIEMANGKAQIEFKPVPFEKTIIEIRNQNLKGNYLILDGITN